MRSAVSLYQFMPYGAPDLIESRRRHLSRRAGTRLRHGGRALRADDRDRGHDSLRAGARQCRARSSSRTNGSRSSGTRRRRPALQPIRSRSRTSEHAAVTPVRDELAVLEGSENANESPHRRPRSAPCRRVRSPPRIRPPKSRRAERWGVRRRASPANPAGEARLPGASAAAPESKESVGVYVMVGKDGRVMRAELDEKQQVPMLNEAALAAARRWVFTPGYANGNPVVCWTGDPVPLPAQLTTRRPAAPGLRRT